MKDMLQTMDYVLWITNFQIFGESDEVSAELNALLEERQKARAEKNYAKADQIRDELSDKGYKIIDSKDWAYLEKM
jgi:cysteinyl-tRNA synthetase